MASDATVVQNTVPDEMPHHRNRKRMGYLKLHEEVELNIKGLSVWAYSKKAKFIGRLEINRAGIEAFTGPKGNTSLGNLSWEDVFERLGRRR